MTFEGNFKLIIVGDGRVGQTSLILRWAGTDEKKSEISEIGMPEPYFDLGGNDQEKEEESKEEAEVEDRRVKVEKLEGDQASILYARR